jgi:hypothetical protein
MEQPTAQFALENAHLGAEGIREAWAAQNATPTEPTPQEPTPAKPTPVEPTPIEPTPTEPTEPTPAVVNWGDFGVSNADELKEKLNRVSEYEGIVSKYKEIEPQLSVLDQVKNPFANDSIAALNNFVSKTGIDNLALASDILNTTTDDLKSDPLKALAIQEILNNPSLSTLSIAKLREYAASKNGVDLSEYGQEGYDLPVSLIVDGAKAIQNIEDKRKEFANINNYFVDLQKNTLENQRVINERVDKWNVATPQITSSIKAIDVKIPSPLEGVDDITVSVAVSAEEVKSAFEGLKGFFYNMDANTEGFAQAQQAIVNTLRLSKQNEIIASAIKAAEGKITERIVKDKHNLQPITEQTAAVESNEKVKSPALQALERRAQGQK